MAPRKPYALSMLNCRETLTNNLTCNGIKHDDDDDDDDLDEGIESNRSSLVLPHENNGGSPLLDNDIDVHLTLKSAGSIANLSEEKDDTSGSPLMNGDVPEALDLESHINSMPDLLHFSNGDGDSPVLNGDVELQYTPMSKKQNVEFELITNQYQFVYDNVNLYKYPLWITTKHNPEQRNQIIKMMLKKHRLLFKDCFINEDECSVYSRNPSIVKPWMLVKMQDRTNFIVNLGNPQPVGNVAMWQKKNLKKLLNYAWQKMFKNFYFLFYDVFDVWHSSPDDKHHFVTGFIFEIKNRRNQTCLLLTNKNVVMDTNLNRIEQHLLGEDFSKIFYNSPINDSQKYFEYLNDRIYRIASFIELFGIHFQQEHILGRILPVPRVLPSDPTQQALQLPSSSIKWALFCFDEKIQEKSLVQVRNQLQLYSPKFGINLDNCYACWSVLLTSKKKLMNMLRNLVNENINYIMFIMPNDFSTKDIKPAFDSADEFYGLVKHLGNQKFGIVTQMMRSGQLDENCMLQQQKIESLFLKLILKLGGLINCLDTASFPVERYGFDPKNTMLIGASVFNGPRHSCMALVGSVDSGFALYQPVSSIINFSNGLNYSIRSNVQNLVEKYKKANGYYPRNIIYMREHALVKKGIFKQEYTLGQEVGAVNQALSRFSSGIKLTYLVVNRRSDVQFSLVNSPESKLDNGTTIFTNDNHFYQCSNSSKFGASKPTHYTIEQNRIPLSKLQLSQLCFDLCHIYFDYWYSNQYPIPVEFAMKCAKMCCQMFSGYIVAEKVLYPDAKQSLNELVDQFNQNPIVHPKIASHFYC